MSDFDLARLVDIMGATTAAVMTDAVNVASSAAASLGVPVSTDEILACPSVRTHIMTDGSYPLDTAHVLSELRSNEAVALRLREHHEDAKSAAEIGAHAATMNPTRRLTYGRQLAGDAQARANSAKRHQINSSLLSPEAQRERAADLNSRSPRSRAQRITEHRRGQEADQK
ncbi:hypothetical protein [Solirhodobacter olei]|uniref:hypothetical protein n=1 Tax=Solirhodobacter olei TaxID=2493082 RepID=UPI000FD9F9F6|nr:hypothetical protein [Solirhodobacter olei]